MNSFNNSSHVISYRRTIGTHHCNLFSSIQTSTCTRYYISFFRCIITHHISSVVVLSYYRGGEWYATTWCLLTTAIAMVIITATTFSWLWFHHGLSGEPVSGYSLCIVHPFGASPFYFNNIESKNKIQDYVEQIYRISFVLSKIERFLWVMGSRVSRFCHCSI